MRGFIGHYVNGASLMALVALAPPDDGRGPNRPSSGQANPLAMPVETQLGNEQGGTMEPGFGSSAVREDQDGLTADIGHDGASVRKDDDSVENEVQQGDSDFEPLPDFDPQNAVVTQQYEAAFTTPDGGYNMANLSADFYANGADGLSEGTYKWLESRGIDRATAKAIEEGQKALAGSGSNAVFQRAGGEQAYRGAVEWAKNGGYTPQQRKAFNDALNAGGDRLADAVDALMARANKANPGGFRAQRRQQPQRSTSAAGGGAAPAAPAVQPYASYADYQRDLRNAKQNNDQALFDQVRKRGKASKFY